MGALPLRPLGLLPCVWACPIFISGSFNWASRGGYTIDWFRVWYKLAIMKSFQISKSSSGSVRGNMSSQTIYTVGNLLLMCVSSLRIESKWIEANRIGPVYGGGLSFLYFKQKNVIKILSDEFVTGRGGSNVIFFSWMRPEPRFRCWWRCSIMGGIFSGS